MINFNIPPVVGDEIDFIKDAWMNNVTSGDYQKYYNEMYEEK